MTIDDLASKIKEKKIQDEFNQLYEKYKESLLDHSGGLLETSKSEFMKFCIFYSEIIHPRITEMFEAVFDLNKTKR